MIPARRIEDFSRLICNNFNCHQTRIECHLSTPAHSTSSRISNRFSSRGRSFQGRQKINVEYLLPEIKVSTIQSLGDLSTALGNVTGRKWKRQFNQRHFPSGVHWTYNVGKRERERNRDRQIKKKKKKKKTGKSTQWSSDFLRFYNTFMSHISKIFKLWITKKKRDNINWIRFYIYFSNKCLLLSTC